MRHRGPIAAGAMLALCLSGCGKAPGGGDAAASNATPAPPPPPAADAGTSASPALAASHATPAPGAGQRAEGTVLEAVNAGEYTYVHVKTATGEIWAASNTFKVAVGDRVSVPLDTPMENFHSPTLNRDFPLVYFASAITPAGAAAATTAALPPGHPAPAPASADLAVTALMPPPKGGMTIANLWNNRKMLEGKSVTVHGKVVKYNGGILGFNWAHLQDGSGNAKDGTNDITITSTAETALGDVITVTGTVVLDKDFGAGYAYKVLLQNATISSK